MKTLDAEKAHGWDNISIKMIQICGDPIVFASYTEVDSKTGKALAALVSLYDKFKEQILINGTNFDKFLIKFEYRY